MHTRCAALRSTFESTNACRTRNIRAVHLWGARYSDTRHRPLFLPRGEGGVPVSGPISDAFRFFAAGLVARPASTSSLSHSRCDDNAMACVLQHYYRSLHRTPVFRHGSGATVFSPPSTTPAAYSYARAPGSWPLLENRTPSRTASQPP